MAQVVSSVMVVTAIEDGHPHGTTVSAFSSLSMQPAQVLIALDQTSRLLGRIERVGCFGVNILASDQGELAWAFAGKGDDKFGGVGWDPSSGSARIRGAAGWVACRVHALLPGGDHVIVVGDILDARSHGRTPLSYQDRTLGVHLPNTAPAPSPYRGGDAFRGLAWE
ncbi:flavin reductase family protein [Aeromicrobium wangtongii]|uniref:flavin reductase family protein n=1 Tax=Aeromicrobium wangtongii TaxID=2969247 RepID=UPI0034E20109